MDVKKNRLYHMRNLRDHLEELFTLCGIEMENVTIEERSAFAEFLEKIVKDNSLYHYLEALDAQSIRAIEVMKDKNLDEWNNRQNEQHLQELLQEKEEWEERHNQEKAELKERCNQEKADLEEQYIREKEDLEARYSQSRQDLDAYRMQSETLEEEYRNQIRMLMELRDSLFMRKDWFVDNAPEEIAAKKLVETQLKETARILKSSGVEISEGTGAYDPDVHTVAGTVPAESEEQIGQIAQTVRSGYRFKGENLRSQEVMIYVKGEE